jgi:hypothetical protein
MGIHRVENYSFEFWRGDPPRFHQTGVETFSRAGTAGTAAKLLGKRGDSFTAELESWFTSYASARSTFPKYLDLIGMPPAIVLFNSRNYFTLHRLKFLIENIEEIECRANARLLGPSINYASGASLVTRWTMTPLRIG